MKLSDFTKIEETKITGTDLVISTRNEMSWFEFLEGTKITDASEKGIYTITKLITGWNLTDDDGKVLPVTEQNVKALPAGVALVLMEKFNKAFEEKSKKKMN